MKYVSKDNITYKIQIIKSGKRRDVFLISKEDNIHFSTIYNVKKELIERGYKKTSKPKRR